MTRTAVGSNQMRTMAATTDEGQAGAIERQCQRQRLVRIGGGLGVKVNAFSIEIFQNGRRIGDEIAISGAGTEEYRMLSVGLGLDPWKVEVVS
jgi:hypothetical protein